MRDNDENQTENGPVRPARTPSLGLPSVRSLGWVDLVLLTIMAGGLFWAVQGAVQASPSASGPTISLSPRSLPLYTALSLSRLFAAYLLSLLFTLGFGYAAASSPRAERILLPTLDVLQSTPITSFLPVVLLAFSALLPLRWAAEAASVVLIVTCQAWNIGFAWYQALTTVPSQLTEAARAFGFNGWLRFRQLQLPFATLSLIWNSMVSWANGWFFLMMAEMLTLGGRQVRLPGLGSYLQEAANQRNAAALICGIVTLLVVIVALDQFIWRPLLAWAGRFAGGADGDEPAGAWFYELLRGSKLVAWLGARAEALGDAIDARSLRWFPAARGYDDGGGGAQRAGLVVAAATVVLALWGFARSAELLWQVPTEGWREIAVGISATFGRVVLALVLSLAWTLPVGVAIGTRPRLAARLQPLVQLAASVPATALFPVVLLMIPGSAAGLSIAAVVLMAAGTQWYLLFNILAGAASIPAEMLHISSLLGFSHAQRWRYLIVPALLPNLVTGAVVATGGAWNVCVVAEYVPFGGHILQTVGAGATIQRAAAAGDYPLLLAATLTLVLVVVLVNRLVWGRLYALAADRFRME